jgi:DNA-binding beta-propeller fold protein YncE
VSRRTTALTALGLLALAGGGWISLRSWHRGVLRAVGPRLVTNQTAVPLALYGEGMRTGDPLILVSPGGEAHEARITALDDGHAYARLPQSWLDLPESVSQAQFRLGLRGREPDQELTVVNDAHFVDLLGLTISRDGHHVFAASPTTDTVYDVDVERHAVTPRAAGDGPSALATWVDPAGREWVVVSHRYVAELWLLAVDAPAEAPRVLSAPSNASGLLVDPASGTAFVAEQSRDTVAAVSLRDGRTLWRTDVAPNPAALGLFAGKVWAGSLQAGVIEALNTATGAHEALAVPTAQTAILGGHTEKLAPLIMGGKAQRALVGSDALGALFVAGVGPNIGPNPDRMEVTMNGGVGVVTAAGIFTHHVGYDAGVPVALALDAVRGRLYVVDLGLGLLRVVDAAKLARGGDDARQSLLAEVPIPPAPGFPLVRPAADFGVQPPGRNRRAGVELHSGPMAVALSPDGARVYVLNRFTGTLAVIDAARVSEGAAAVTVQIPVADTLGQRTRRLGQVLYFTDMGRSAMSCDTCHLEGHGEGVLFEKTHPMRIYRSTTVRGARDTPPYFTPASTYSISQTVHDVGDRNRYHNPDLTPGEIQALTTFTTNVTTVPNPFVSPEGAPPDTLTLLDGKGGHPRAGLALFEGKAGCASCHPAPLFTTDQDSATRGHYLDVGTPKLFPLRERWQEQRFVGAGVPSLVGSWDVWPMLTTGAAGFGLQGEQLIIQNRYAAREVVEKFGGPAHGHTEALTPQDKDDLLAYLLTL